MTVSDEYSSKPLKRLGMIQRYAHGVGSFVATGQSLYTSIRAKSPAFAQTSIAKLEDITISYAAPAATYTMDTADKMLRYADDQVDGAVLRAHSMYKYGEALAMEAVNSVYAINAANTKTAKEAASRYFSLVSGTGQWVAEKLSPSANVAKAKAVLDSTIAKAQKALDPDVAVQMVADAWSTFASVPAVSKLLSTAEPVTSRGMSTFTAMHDYIVANSLYKQGVLTGNSLAKTASSTSLYTAAHARLYPLVKPMADPVLNKLSSSKVIASTLQYWAPL